MREHILKLVKPAVDKLADRITDMVADRVATMVEQLDAAFDAAIASFATSIGSLEGEEGSSQGAAGKPLVGGRTTAKKTRGNRTPPKKSAKKKPAKQITRTCGCGPVGRHRKTCTLSTSPASAPPSLKSTSSPASSPSRSVTPPPHSRSDSFSSNGLGSLRRDRGSCASTPWRRVTPAIAN